MHGLLATLGVEENAGHMELCKNKIDETIAQLNGTLSAIDEALQEALAAKGAPLSGSGGRPDVPKFNITPGGSSATRPIASDDAKAIDKAEQIDEPARPRIASAVNIDVSANLAGAAWAVTGVLFHMPIEAIVGGTVATSAMNVWQALTAEVEDIRENRKGKGR